MSDLPEGFVLDDAPKVTALPEGFVLDTSDGAKKPRDYAASEVPGQALSNFVPSLVEEVKNTGEGLVEAVTSPVQTAGTLAKLMTTTSPLMPDIRRLSQMISPLLGDEGRARVSKVVEDLYAPRDAMVKTYEDRYGGWDKIKRTAAEKPAAMLMDASTFLTPVAAAKNAPGVIGKVGRAANIAAAATDPIGLAAAGVGKVAGTVIPEVLGKSTGAGADSFKEAFRAGYEGGPAAVDFRKAITNQTPMESIIGTAKGGVQKIRDEMMADYRANKAVWDKHQGTVDFTPIDKAATQLLDDAFSKSGSGHSKLAPTEQAQLKKLTDVVDEWQRDPATHTIEGLDALKQRLYNEIDPKTAHPFISRAATKLSAATRDAIMKSAPPEYRTAMRNYTEGSKLVEELEDAFSLGKKAKMQTAMSKLQSLMRNNAATQYGVRAQQMNKLRERSGADVFPALAGQALNSWTPRGIQGTLSVPAALGSFSLAGLPGVGAQMALTSPRAMGEAAYGAGRAAALPQGAFRLARNKGIPGASAAEFAANQSFRRPARMTYRQLGQMEEEEPRGYFAP